MSRQVSSKTSSTKKECTTNLSTKKKGSTSEQSRIPLPQWKPTEHHSHLTVGEITVYAGRLAKITYIDALYVVVTPSHMQYGVCVHHEYIHRILKLYDTDTQSTGSN